VRRERGWNFGGVGTPSISFWRFWPTFLITRDIVDWLMLKLFAFNFFTICLDDSLSMEKARISASASGGICLGILRETQTNS